MLDFTHAKVRATPSAVVNHSGTLPGGPPPSPTPISSMFDVLEFTDGIGLLTLNGLYRFEPIGRFQPYVGAGIGINIPHVEVTTHGGGGVTLPTTFQYAFGGAAAQVLAGADIRLTKHWSAFAEYKLSWAGVNAPLASGGYRIHTNLITNHILAGVALHFGGN
jgi:lipid A oxidase